MSKNEGLVALREFLAARELPMPYVPAEIAGEIAPLEEGLFAAGDVAGELIAVRDGATLAEGDVLPTSIVVGLGGRGMQSSTILYHLAEEPLILLVDLPWAEVYGSREDEIAEVEEAFRQIETLVAEAPRLLDAGDRLVVTSSDDAGTSFLVYTVGSGASVVRSPAWRNAFSLGEILMQLEE